ncbi:MAG: DUF6364 family protein [Alkalispirochaeta sp.]
MNITLSAQDELVEKARRYAGEHGTSLNQLIRDYLERLVGSVSAEDAAAEFVAVARELGGDSSGTGGVWTGREDLYAERLDRFGRNDGAAR